MPRTRYSLHRDDARGSTFTNHYYLFDGDVCLLDFDGEPLTGDATPTGNRIAYWCDISDEAAETLLLVNAHSWQGYDLSSTDLKANTDIWQARLRKIVGLTDA